MQLSALEIQQVTKILKKSSKRYWSDPIVLKVIEIVNRIRDGTIHIDDWFIPDVLTYRDYCYQIFVQDFVLVKY